MEEKTFTKWAEKMTVKEAKETLLHIARMLDEGETPSYWEWVPLFCRG